MKASPGLFCIPLFLLSCHSNKIPSAETLANAYVDVSMLAGTYQHSDSTFTSDQHKQELAAALHRYDLTPDRFRAAMDSLAQRPEEFQRFYQLANAKLQHVVKQREKRP